MKISGCTVHFADDDYDQGPIILQEAVPVEEDDTADSPRGSRVHEAENRLYPEAIRLWAAGRLRLARPRRVRIRIGTERELISSPQSGMSETGAASADSSGAGFSAGAGVAGSDPSSRPRQPWA